MGEMYEALQQLYYPAPSLAGRNYLLQKWKYFCWETLAADINIQSQHWII